MTRMNVVTKTSAVLGSSDCLCAHFGAELGVAGLRATIIWCKLLCL